MDVSQCYLKKWNLRKWNPLNSALDSGASDGELNTGGKIREGKKERSLIEDMMI